MTINHPEAKSARHRAEEREAAFGYFDAQIREIEHKADSRERPTLQDQRPGDMAGLAELGGKLGGVEGLQEFDRDP